MEQHFLRKSAKQKKKRNSFGGLESLDKPSVGTNVNDGIKLPLPNAIEPVTLPFVNTIEPESFQKNQNGAAAILFSFPIPKPGSDRATILCTLPHRNNGAKEGR